MWRAPGTPECWIEPVHFLEGRPVNPEDDSYYDLPVRSVEAASLYQHCVRAITRGLRFGEHGLPLMGSGDWNDGMNRVGIGGKGESVWLGFFLCEVLRQFSELARAHDDSAFAELCVQKALVLRQKHRAARLGRRVVSPRLLRRRYATRLRQQHRMPYRFDLAELGRTVRRGCAGSRWRQSRTFAPGHAGRRCTAGEARCVAHATAGPAFRHVEPGSGLYPRATCRA
jgi:hypothetical protein